MSWTILLVILWNGDMIAEDFGQYNTIEHCQKVAEEVRAKMILAGTETVAICVPASADDAP